MGNDLFYTCQALKFSLNRAIKNTGNNPRLLECMLHHELNCFPNVLSSSLIRDSVFRYPAAPVKSELTLKLDPAGVCANWRVGYPDNLAELMMPDWHSLLKQSESQRLAKLLTGEARVPHYECDDPSTLENIIKDPGCQIKRAISDVAKSGRNTAASSSAESRFDALHPNRISGSNEQPKLGTTVSKAFTKGTQRQQDELKKDLKDKFNRNPAIYLIMGGLAVAAVDSAVCIEGKNKEDMTRCLQLNDWLIDNFSDNVKWDWSSGRLSLNGGDLPIPAGSKRLIGAGAALNIDVNKWISVGIDS